MNADVAQGDAMGIPVIAEGIEKEEQAQCILDLGCAQGQGYLFGMPLYSEVMETCLRNQPEVSARQPEANAASQKL